MSEITQSLNLAFDTTMVALVAGLLLNFLYHRYLSEVDTYFSKVRSYVIDNLISRIYRPAEVDYHGGQEARTRANGRAPVMDLTGL